jgi:hypothetical protein
MLYGFIKFNEVQPNISQWRKIIEYLDSIIEKESDLLSDLIIDNNAYDDLIFVINSVDQVPTAEQWRNIKNLIEKIIISFEKSKKDDVYTYTNNVYINTPDFLENYFIDQNYLDDEFNESSNSNNNEEIKILDNFVSKSYKQTSFDF